MSEYTSTHAMKPQTFLLGQDARVTILATAEDTNGRHDITDCQQIAGGTTPLHVHTRYDERLWVVSGSLTVWAGQEKRTLHPGDFYTIPMNVPHAMRAGSEGARALNISSPAAFAELAARAGTPDHLATPETELDVDRFMEVTTQLGDVILGPPGTTPADRPAPDAANGQV